MAVFCQGARDEEVERWWYLRIVQRGRRRLGIQNLGAHRAERTAIEGSYASQHLIKNNSESKLIRARTVRVALDLFGRKVCGGAHQLVGAENLQCKARDAEIAEFYLVFRGDQDVAESDAAVNDSGAMGNR